MRMTNGQNQEQPQGVLPTTLARVQEYRNILMVNRQNMQRDLMAARQKGFLGTGQGQVPMGPFMQMIQQRRATMQATLQGNNNLQQGQQPTTILGMFLSSVRAIQQTRPRLLQYPGQPGQAPGQPAIPQLPIAAGQGIYQATPGPGQIQIPTLGGGGGGGGGSRMTYQAQPELMQKITMS